MSAGAKSKRPPKARRARAAGLRAGTGRGTTKRALPSYEAIRGTKTYEDFLKALYARASARVEELQLPEIRVLAVTGNEPPGSKQYENAVAALYGIAYGVRMGLKFGKLPKPEGWFDFKVGALETIWWTTAKRFDIANAKTLRWQAFLMVPAFVTRALVQQAAALARAKHPEVPYQEVALTTLAEGRAVQVLHVGPYAEEQPAIDALHAYAAERGLTVSGRHHEIYLSDPRRTAPARLKTVIRLPVESRAAPPG